NQKTPVKVASNVKFADAGRVNTVYISSANDLYIAGDGSYGQIGNGSAVDRTSYLKVLSGVKTADCGYSCVAAVKTDGKLFAWGANSDGRLGTGSTSNVTVPTAVAAGIESVEFGSNHLLVAEQWPYYFEGTEKATNVGSYTATAKLRSHAKWSDGTSGNVTLKWKITGEYNMSGVSFQSKVVTYTGKKQDLTISGTLPSGVSVSYVGNGKTDVGTYTVTAKFAGDTSLYAPIPDKTATLTIQQAQLSNCTCSIPDQIYTGRAVEPEIDLYLGDFLLTKGVHYKVTQYHNNVAIGQAQMRVEGMGNLTGSKTLYFNIVERPIWMSFPDVVKEVNKAGGPHKVWYVADGWLDYVVKAGLMSGYASNGYFGPYDNITRGQVAVILYRAECVEDPSLIEKYGSTTDPAKYAWLCAFVDMDASVYYTAAINWAKAAGIMTGDAATNYTTVRPNDSVTREELCLMLARYANGGVVPNVELDPSKAQNILGMNKISSWARNGVYWAVNNGVIGGVNNGNGTFSMDPQGKTWRSAAAKMFTVVTRDIL
ncbi:MAG: S-layer homology domain-containing protein, partial [Eggerthellaceae bacterium]|nr:S-layer homology domain-containing protein [Eggerthellaceae bacterium]